jgi:hypothetical protein
MEMRPALPDVYFAGVYYGTAAPPVRGRKAEEGVVAVDTAAGKADIARRDPVVTKSGLPAEDQIP